jgi:hypothetical protein
MLVFGRVSSVLPKWMDTFDNILAFIFDVSRKEFRDMVGRIVVLLWKIWADQNDYVWNEERETSNNIGWLSLGNWQQWHEANLQQQCRRS